MSTTAPEPPTLEDAPPAGDRSELLQLRDEVRRQGEAIKTSQRAFSIFAFLAFCISMTTLLAVVFKLDAKDTTTAPAATPTAATPAPALGRSVSVGLGEFYVKPSVTAAAAGPIRFAVRNEGSATHEFVVLKTDKPAGSLLKGASADETGNVGETGDLAPGASKTVTLKLAAGHYALICNLPGHYKAGQHVDFSVR